MVTWCSRNPVGVRGHLLIRGHLLSVRMEQLTSNHYSLDKVVTAQFLQVKGFILLHVVIQV